MPTIKDIAKASGLSIATVSKYLNGGTLKEENRVLIEKAVNELDYKVNYFARGLKTRRTMTVGVCLPQLESPFFARIVSVFEEILLSKGYATIICDYRDDPTLEKERLRFLISKNVDGIVLVPSAINAAELASIAGSDVPVVLLDRSVRDSELDTILTDNVNASYAAVEALATRKHKRIGVILGPEGIFTAEERLKGYTRVLEDFGLTVERELIKVGDYKMESGYSLMNEMLDIPEPPSAVFVTNYEMTVGAVVALNERNVSLPDELSFIGFDNISLAQITKPWLSIVAQPMEEIGQLSAQILLKRISDDYSDFPVFARLKADLCEGGSVAQHAQKNR